jgi:hypothetical protein
MQLLVQEIRNCKDRLQEIQAVFQNNPNLQEFEASYETDADDGDLNMRWYGLKINGQTISMKYNEDDDDGDDEIENLEEVETDLMTKEELTCMEYCIGYILDSSDETNCNTIIIKREEILSLDIKSI